MKTSRYFRIATKHFKLVLARTHFYDSRIDEYHLAWRLRIRIGHRMRTWTWWRPEIYVSWEDALS